MRQLYDADAVRAAEQPLLDSLPPGTLMHRASYALARRCAQLLGSVAGRRVVLLVGPGNNGADALFAGALLARRGVRVDAVLVTGDAHGDALSALVAAGGRVNEVAASESLLGRADLAVDGMLGIGARGRPRPAYRQAIEALTAADVCTVAVDVPTGVDASTGVVEGEAVRADVTVTFGALKVGLLVAPGAGHAGLVELVDIGLVLPPAAVAALDAPDVARLLPRLGAETDKYSRGVVGVAAGSDRYPGAAVLAVGGAVAAGAGMVRYVGPERPAALVRQRWPEAIVSADLESAGRVQAWVVGSGLGTDGAAVDTVRRILSTDEPVVADADATTVLARDPELLRRRPPTLLTPHAGEFARLAGTDRAPVEARRLAHVQSLAERLGATVLLKGSTTLVADPRGHVRVNTAQTPYLGTAGSGDVLSGICGALLAGGLAPLDAGAAAAFLHGLAGITAAGDPPAPFAASAIVDALPGAMRAVRGSA